MTFKDVKIGERFYQGRELFEKMDKKEAISLELYANSRPFDPWEEVTSASNSKVWAVVKGKDEKIVFVHSKKLTAEERADSLNEAGENKLYKVKEIVLYD